MIPRRAPLAAGPLALAACRTTEGAYFGRTDPPERQRLVSVLGAEPATLDPALSLDRWEAYVIHALFEGLTALHPLTGEPIAALATHYDVSASGLQYRFYLRGHQSPRGIRLADTGDLPSEYSRGRPAPDGTKPARWSDGTPITADDVIYSWRWALDPASGATYSYLLHYLQKGREVNAGKLRPDALGVRTIDPFQLEVDLESRTVFFLQLLSHRVGCVVPRQAIERYGLSWTDAGRMISGGAFLLRERRPNDTILLARNPHYYERHSVALEELEFQIVVDGAATANLYRAGTASVAQPLLPQLLPSLSRKKDFHAYPMHGLVFPMINTSRPPLDDVRVRYSLNMATDKRALAAFMGAGRLQARSLAPPAPGYTSPQELSVTLDGLTCDVLSYDPQRARELFIKAGHNVNQRLAIQFLLPNLPEARPISEILQQQWRRVLGIELVLVKQDLQTWLQTVLNRAFTGVAFWGDAAGYVDPTWWLDQFQGVSPANPTNWADSQFDRLLSEAALTTDISARMTKLHEAERQLLLGMPCLPLYTDAWTYLRKPFVHGLGANALDFHQWKYAWIDTNWRPS